MKRKDFILLATTGIAAVAIPTSYYFLWDVEYNPLLAQPKSLSMIWDTETINKTGSAYRLQVPGEEGQRSLVNQLLETSANGQATDSELEQTIKKDFETGNTVMIGGWVLSVTEARQCALFSTTQSE